MGKDATLFHHATSDDDTSTGSQYVEQMQTWFETIWTTVAEPVDAVTAPTATDLATLLPRTRYLLLDFDGPICAIFAGRRRPRRRARAARRALERRTSRSPSDVAAATDPFDVLRFAATVGPELAERIEHAATRGRTRRRSHRHAHPARRPTSSPRGATPAEPSPPSATTRQRRSRPTSPTTASELDAIVARTSPDPALLKPSPHLCTKQCAPSTPSRSDSTIVGDSPSDIVAARERRHRQHRLRQQARQTREAPECWRRQRHRGHARARAGREERRLSHPKRPPARAARDAPAPAPAHRAPPQPAPAPHTTTTAALHQDRAAPPASRTAPAPPRPAGASTPTAPDRNADHPRDGSGSIATNATSLAPPSTSRFLFCASPCTGDLAQGLTTPAPGPSARHSGAPPRKRTTDEPAPSPTRARTGRPARRSARAGPRPSAPKPGRRASAPPARSPPRHRPTARTIAQAARDGAAAHRPSRRVLQQTYDPPATPRRQRSRLGDATPHLPTALSASTPHRSHPAGGTPARNSATRPAGSPRRRGPSGPRTTPHVPARPPSTRSPSSDRATRSIAPPGRAGTSQPASDPINQIVALHELNRVRRGRARGEPN